MRPLLYLAARSFVNALRRTLRSPWRLIPVLLFTAWQASILGRALFRPRGGKPAVEILPRGVQLPGDEVVAAIAFAAMLAVVMLNALGLGALRATFRASDADVLFPTPVTSKSIIAWRVVTDSLMRLILPLLFGSVALAIGRTEAGSLAALMPDAARLGRVAQTGVLTYLVLTVAFSVWGWALSLWLYRPTVGPNRGPLVAGILSALYVAAPAAVFAQGALRGKPLETLAWMSNEPLIVALYFPAKLAAMVVVSPVSGGTAAALTGALGIGAFLATGIWMTGKNSPYLYEQSSLRAYQVSASVAAVRTQGAGYSAVLAKASRAKRTHRTLPWAERWRASGPAALIWKEAVITARTGALQVALATGVVCALVVAASRIPESRPALILTLLVLSFAPLACSPSTRSIVLPEALLRLDLVKPLPFSSWQLLATDAASRTLVPLAATTVPTLLAAALHPRDVALILAGWMGGNAYAFAFVTGMLPAAIAFPDSRDPAQTTLRGLVSGLVTLFSIGLLATPALVLAVLRLPAWPGLLLSAVALTGLGLMAASLAGRMYDTFNPADP